MHPPYGGGGIIMAYTDSAFLFVYTVNIHCFHYFMTLTVVKIFGMFLKH